MPQRTEPNQTEPNRTELNSTELNGTAGLWLFKVEQNNLCSIFYYRNLIFRQASCQHCRRRPFCPAGAYFSDALFNIY